MKQTIAVFFTLTLALVLALTLAACASGVSRAPSAGDERPGAFLDDNSGGPTVYGQISVSVDRVSVD